MSQSTSNYYAKLRDPRWQRKRLEIMQRDNFTCQSCGLDTKTLNVHHCYYQKDASPWDYPDSSLTTLCEDCHETETGNGLWAKKELSGALAQRGWLFGHFQWLAYLIHNMKRPITPRGLMLIFMHAIQKYEEEGLPEGCKE